jgi:hypothetical protein
METFQTLQLAPAAAADVSNVRSARVPATTAARTDD